MNKLVVAGQPIRAGDPVGLVAEAVVIPLSPPRKFVEGEATHSVLCEIVGDQYIAIEDAVPIPPSRANYVATPSPMQLAAAKDQERAAQPRDAEGETP